MSIVSGLRFGFNVTPLGFKVAEDFKARVGALGFCCFSVQGLPVSPVTVQPPSPSV